MLLNSFPQPYVRFVKSQQEMKYVTRLQPGCSPVINDFRKSASLRGKVASPGTMRFSFFGGKGPAGMRQNPPSGALNSILPGPREGSSILNVDLEVLTAAVGHPLVHCENSK